jgi:hypothetical protein
MRTFLAALAVVACAVLAACSTVSVSTDFDSGVDFDALKTFAWMPLYSKELDPYDADSLVRGRVVSAVERELSAKGLQRVDASPDFVIALHSWTRERFNVTTWPRWGYGWGPRRRMWSAWGGDRVDVTQYTEGALVVDFVNQASKELIWRGIARSVVDESSSSQEAVDESVEALLAKFPPKRQ